ATLWRANLRKPCLRSLGRRLFQTSPPSPFFSIGPIDQAPAGASRCTVCGTEKLAERHLRIRKRSKGSVNYISGGFCETNPLSVFVCNGKKRGPTNVLQLQSSSLASGFAERVPDLHHGLLGSLFGHPDMVPPEPAACLSGKVRSPVDPTEGDRDDWRSGRSSPSWPFSYGTTI